MFFLLYCSGIDYFIELKRISSRLKPYIFCLLKIPLKNYPIKSGKELLLKNL